MKLTLNNEAYFVRRVTGLGKVRGLMFSKKENLLFDLNNRRELIHSFYVFFPIKLYFLDEDFKILETGVLRPFWFYLPKVKAKYLIEIPV